MLTTANAAQIPLADGVVHACVTSPPFWSLRDYGLEPMRWPAVTYRPMPGLPPVTVPAMDACLGLESTPEAYVGHIVAVFREVWRVLRGDGTAWVNLGDSYADVGRSHQQRRKDANGIARPKGKKTCERCGTEFEGGPGRRFCSSYCGGSDNSKRAGRSSGLKPKDLIGIPWRVAFALQADGWWLRSDILWIKPNCMPESVRDRPTKAHEYIFLLAKSKRYYYDADAVREPHTMKPQRRLTQRHSERDDAMAADKKYLYELRDKPGVEGNSSGRNRRTAWTIPTSPYGGAHYAAYPRELVRIMLKASVSERGVCPTCGKPWKRVVRLGRVQSTGGGPGREASGMCLVGNQGNSNCGKMAQREHITVAWRPSCTCTGKPSHGPVQCEKCRGTGREQKYQRGAQNWTAGSAVSQPQRDSCGGLDGIPIQDTGAPCPHCDGGTTEGDVWPSDVDTWPVAPAIVLDPFVGSGTTAVVCQELHQKGTPITCVGLDLNHHYLADLARERLGLLALEAWEQGRDSSNGRGLEELPLFKEMGNNETSNH